MIKIIAIIITAGLFIACSSSGNKTNIATADTLAKVSLPKVDNYFTTDGDSLVIPSFEIELSLSKKAEEKLANDKETVIVAAWFAGQPKDTTTKEYAESGEMFVNAAQLELGAERIAKFEGIKFSKAKYDSLADKDISVLVNIFSGRKSTQYNLLDCTILTDKMGVVRGRKFVLVGKLIDEPGVLAK